MGRKLEAGESFGEDKSLAPASAPAPPSSTTTTTSSRPSLASAAFASTSAPPGSRPLAGPAKPNPPAAPPATRFQAQTPSQLKLESVCPVNVLTPFFNAWVIRVRVTNKTPLKTYNNAKGGGKLFSFDTVDETGELRVTAFNAEAERWYETIERNKVYLISKGSVKAANKRFSSLNADYEVTLNAGSIIEPVEGLDSEASIPRLRFKFIPLAEVENLPAGTTVDVIGVIRSVGEPETLLSKRTSKEMIKRDVTLVDASLAEGRLSLWHETAAAFAGLPGEILALKGALVGEFKGKTLSTTNSTVLDIEPEGVDEAAVLRSWWSKAGASATFTALSRQAGDPGRIDASHRFICQITPQLVESNAAAAASASGGTLQTYSSLNGTISASSRGGNHLYKSCPSEGCMKKVADDSGEGLYYCAKCDRNSPSFSWRLMLSVAIADATGSTWVTIFEENAVKLLGMTAAELAHLTEVEPGEAAATIARIRFTGYYFRLGSKMEEYNGEARVRSSLYTVVPHKPLERSRRLLALIPRMAEQL